MKNLLSILGLVFAHTPECVMRLLCRAVGALICYFPCWRTRVAYANVRHCFPDMDPREVRKTVFESCSRMVEMALFVVASPHMPVKRLAKRVVIDDFVEKKLAEFSANPRPLVLLVPHFAMMETITMFPLLAKNAKLPATGVFYRPFDSAGMETWVKQSRQRFGIEMLSRRTGMLSAVDILKRKGCVAVLFDQNAGMAGCESLLFDMVCSTSELAGILAERTNAVCAVFFAERTGFWSSRICGEMLDASDMESITYAGNEWLERRLRESTVSRYDWLWLHKRWKIYPDQPRSVRMRGGKSILDYTLKRRGLDALPRTRPIYLTLPDSFKDMQTLAPILERLRLSRPDARVVLLCGGECGEFFSKRPDCADEVVVLPTRKKFAARFAALRAESKKYPEISLAFEDSFWADAESRILNAPQRNAVRFGRRRRFMTWVYDVRGKGAQSQCAAFLKMLEASGMR